MKRRHFIASGLTLAVAGSRLAAAVATTNPKRGFRVPAGRDRREEPMRLGGQTPTDTKVSTADADGGLYLFEHRHMGRGGPPRHFHYAQDEWFYAIEGEFEFHVGDERFLLRAGDLVFLPRMLPHVWANVGDAPGSILGAVSPAGTFETFFRELASLGSPPAAGDAERLFAAHGMKIVGPPLAH